MRENAAIICRTLPSDGENEPIARMQYEVTIHYPMQYDRFATESSLRERVASAVAEMERWPQIEKGK